MDDEKHPMSPKKQAPVPKSVESDSTQDNEPYRIFQTSADFQAHNRRITQRYQRSCETQLFKFCLQLFVQILNSNSNFFVLHVSIDRLPSEQAYKDLKSWWCMNVSRKRVYQANHPTLPTIKELKNVQSNLLQAEEMIEFKRIVTSVRAIASSVKVNGTYFPRNGTWLCFDFSQKSQLWFNTNKNGPRCTATLRLKYPIADGCEALINKLKEFSMQGKFLCRKLAQKCFLQC